jgi:hypothetical protein
MKSYKHTNLQHHLTNTHAHTIDHTHILAVVESAAAASIQKDSSQTEAKESRANAPSLGGGRGNKRRSEGATSLKQASAPQSYNKEKVCSAGGGQGLCLATVPEWTLLLGRLRTVGVRMGPGKCRITILVG